MNGRYRNFLALLGLASALAFAQAPTAEFDLPAQGLAESLRAVASATRLNVLYDTAKLADRQAPQLKGRVSADEALTKLLEGSGLTYRYLDEKTVVLAERRAESEGKRTSWSEEGIEDRVRVAQADVAAPESAPSSPESADSTGAQETPQEEALEEITVTAQKRLERLQDVPISISVLSGDSLERSSVRSIAEALNRVPGVANVPAVGDSRGGGNSKWAIRGVTASAGTSTVGYYMDSIPFGFVRFDFTPDPSPYDLDRVEVLRGPQGTLYGASSLNGVIRVLTHEANLNEFEVKTRTSVSSTQDGDESYRGDLAVNVPIVEGKLAARAVLGYQHLGGWIDKPIEENANDGRIRTARLRLNAQPSDQLSVGLLAWFSRSDYGAPPISADGRQTPSLVNEPSSTDYDAYSLKLDYRFPQLSLTSATSYLKFSTVGIFDFSSFTAPDASFADTRTSSNVFSQEINLISNLEGPWQWSAGGIYRDSEDPVFQILQPFGLIFDDNEIGSQSFAGFGELSRMFLDRRFEVTAGLRYFEDKVTDKDFVSGDSPTDRFDSLSPRAVLTWHLPDQSTIYASYGEGFRSGLSQFPATRAAAPFLPPADPDTLKNYELGAKTTKWSGRLNLDTAVYFIDWQEVQQKLGFPFQGSLVSGFTNGDSASGVGIDLGVTLEPIDGLTLGANLSWNDLKFDQDVIFTDAVLGEVVLFTEGSRLSYSPKETAGISVDYAFPLGGGGLDGRISASANYISGQTSREFLGGTDPVAIGAGDSILTGRAAFTIESADRWAATLFADNIANDNGVVNRDLFMPIWNSRLRPRTVGLQLEYKFAGK